VKAAPDGEHQLKPLGDGDDGMDRAEERWKSRRLFDVVFQPDAKLSVTHASVF
jgi:hypothetical protein